MPESSIPISSLPEFAGDVDIHTTSGASIDAGLVGHLVRRILGDAGFTSGAISLAVVDDATIHDLNRRYLNHDYPTDVLSFLLESDPGQGTIEGEVIVSMDTAARTAPEFQWTPESELMLYVVHGTLHLTGLDDATPAQRDQMRAMETQYLIEAGLDCSQRIAGSEP